MKLIAIYILLFLAIFFQSCFFRANRAKTIKLNDYKIRQERCMTYLFLIYDDKKENFQYQYPIGNFDKIEGYNGGAVGFMRGFEKYNYKSKKRFYLLTDTLKANFFLRFNLGNSKQYYPISNRESKLFNTVSSYVSEKYDSIDCMKNVKPLCWVLAD